MIIISVLLCLRFFYFYDDSPPPLENSSTLFLSNSVNSNKNLKDENNDPNAKENTDKNNPLLNENISDFGENLSKKPTIEIKSESYLEMISVEAKIPDEDVFVHKENSKDYDTATFQRLSHITIGKSK